MPSEESSAANELSLKESQNGESCFKGFRSLRQSEESDVPSHGLFTNEKDQFDQVQALGMNKFSSERRLLPKKKSSKIDDYSFKTPFSNKFSNHDVQKSADNGEDEQEFIEEDNKSFDLFIDSEDPKTQEYSSDPEKPLLSEDEEMWRKEWAESRKDIWTNAILQEINLEGSERSLASFQIHLKNISVPRNHLKLNIILRIVLLLCYIGDVGFLPWIRNSECIDDKEKGGKEYCNINPAWLFYKKGLYFYFQLMNGEFCKDKNLKESFCTDAPFNFLAGSFTLLIAFLVIVFEILAMLSILNLVMDYRVKWFRASIFQRYSYIFIFATVVIWFCSLRLWWSLKFLSFGFYGMFAIFIGCILLKFHYRFFKTKLYRRRQINHLLLDK
ncbi:unnamed protein product [Moneuplotes crassus]|uniref:Uncharacterized protein n=1 Tax=Euplotes crassus TaxID=5936 RepID=A0AAD1URB4_EUPCR|nr:unnamed protein product [Moneuplotes crassus]